MAELVIQPGIVKSTTATGPESANRWTDCDKVRFVNGKPEKVLGWTKYFVAQLTGLPRDIHSYLGPYGYELVAVGTTHKLYIEDVNGTVEDITPLRKTTSPTGTDPFAVTDLSTTVTVTDTAHGAIVGATVIFTGATAGGGITISGPYLVATVVNANSYTITHSAAATSTDATTGGVGVVAKYEINPGAASNSLQVGYGVGPYGSSTYGTARAIGIVVPPYIWSLDNYGNLLEASTPNGTIYLYNHETDDRAQPLTNAPTDVIASFVTQERFIFALRAGMILEWADQDDPTDWTASAVDTANERTLAAGSRLIGGSSVSEGLSLIWTDRAVYLAQYTGSSFIYETRLVGENCGLLGPNAFTTHGGAAFWMSRNGFFVYSGQTQTIPNAPDITDYVFDHLELEHGFKTVCFFNEVFREVWWVYVSAQDTGEEPSRYVAVNIDDWSWTIGTLARTAATSRSTNVGRPLLTSAAGWVYQHEHRGHVDETEGSTATLANDPFAIVDLSAVVTVTHVAHGAMTGDTVSYSGASAGGGITILGDYTLTYLTADTYTITHTTAGTSTDATTGGSAVVASYALTRALPWHLTTGWSAVPGATHTVDVFGFSPDFERIGGTVTLTITGKDRPQSTELDSEEIALTSTSEMEDCRIAGRYVQLAFSQDEIGGDFRLGTPVLEAQPGSLRR